MELPALPTMDETAPPASPPLIQLPCGLLQILSRSGSLPLPLQAGEPPSLKRVAPAKGFAPSVEPPPALPPEPPLEPSQFSLTATLSTYKFRSPPLASVPSFVNSIRISALPALAVSLNG